MTQEPTNMNDAIAAAQATMAAMGMDPRMAQAASEQAAVAARQIAANTFAPDGSPDFSSHTSKTPLHFDMDGDRFFARPRVGGGVVLGLAKVAAIEDVGAQVGLIESFLKKVLLPGSYTLFTARLNGTEYTDQTTGQKYNGEDENGEPYPDLEPIELPQVLNVFKHLVGKYTNGDATKGFPTPESSESPGGPLNTGLSSSALAPLTGVSTPAT